jgi:hypothetical protein
MGAGGKVKDSQVPVRRAREKVGKSGWYQLWERGKRGKIAKHQLGAGGKGKDSQVPVGASRLEFALSKPKACSKLRKPAPPALAHLPAVFIAGKSPRIAGAFFIKGKHSIPAQKAGVR